MQPTDFMLSDNQLRIICFVNGLVTLLINLLCLYLIKNLLKNIATNIYAVTLLLQGLYFGQNVVFNFMLVPFLYAEYGGGYCIGIVCNTKILPFWVFMTAYSFLTCSISGCFVLLLFFRHQSLLFTGSTFKLSQFNARTVVIMITINIVPVLYIVESMLMSPDEHLQLLKKMCPTCDWIERSRNFSVFDAQAAKVNASIVVATVFVFSVFGVSCAWQIMNIMRNHRKNSVIRGSRFTMTILQTKQSFVQIFLFVAFLAMPILIFMSRPLLHAPDGILVPTILLLSLSSLAHSVTLIASTPAFQRHICIVIFKCGNVEDITFRSPHSTVVK